MHGWSIACDVRGSYLVVVLNRDFAARAYTEISITCLASAIVFERLGHNWLEPWVFLGSEPNRPLVQEGD